MAYHSHKLCHLNAIKSHYETHYYSNFTSQIGEKAKTLPDGSFNDRFEKSYNFKEVLFSYRMSTLHGKFEGEINTLPSGNRVIKGTTEIQFIDWFSDPVDMRQITLLLINQLRSNPMKDKEIAEFYRIWSEVGGKPYPILEKWDRKIEINIQ